MLTATVTKIKNCALLNHNFILNVLSENALIFVRTGLFFKIKNVVGFTEMCFLRSETACACVNIRKYVTSQVSIVGYNTFMQLFSHREDIAI